MSEVSAPGRRSWPAITFATGMVLLLGWNLWVIARNQRAYGPRDRPHVVPRDIAAVAILNSYEGVWATFRWYYQLRALGAGTTIVVEPEMARHRFYLEEVSRLRVEVAPAPTIVEQTLIDHVHDGLRAMVDGARSCVIATAPGATRYLTARTPDFKSYMIVTEARYRQELAWYQAELPRHPEWMAQLVEQVRPNSPPFLWYFRMRQLGTGATIVVAPEMAGHRFYLEHLSHLRVEVAKDSIEVDPRMVAHLAPAEIDMLDWVRGCAIVVDPGATRYVVVRTPDFKTYVVMSEARYRQELASPSSRP